MSGKVSPARLREAREYLGFGVEQAAQRLSCAPMLLEAIESGTAGNDGYFVFQKHGWNLAVVKVERILGGA